MFGWQEVQNAGSKVEDKGAWLLISDLRPDPDNPRNQINATADSNRASNNRTLNKLR